MWKRVKKLLKIEFDSKSVYGENDRYIKIKTWDGRVNTNFQGNKNTERKCTIQVFINNNDRFCYQSKEKASFSNTLEECKYEPKKIKMENLINEDLKKSSSDESDNDSNDEIEFDNEKDNGKSNE